MICESHKIDQKIMRFFLNNVRTPAVLYVFRSLIREEIPTNAGCGRPISILTQKGSIVDARFPAPVAGGNIEALEYTYPFLVTEIRCQKGLGR